MGGFFAAQFLFVFVGILKGVRMVKIILVQPGGIRIEAKATPGNNIMGTALKYSIPGISFDCNGSSACAACHVVVGLDVLNSTPAMKDHENDLLDYVATKQKQGSRLSCQVLVIDRLEG